MSTPFWTLDRVARTLGGGPAGPAPLTAVSTDTRSLAGGELFVALQGERYDAHDFLADAVRAGAAAVVVSRPESARGLGVPVFVAADTLHALGALARERRRAWGGRVVGVAGSNGKTSTKELARSALATRLRVHATQGNLNNLIGVPLTLLAIPDDAEIAVVEIGTNVPGEVPRLRDIAMPDIAIVTSIGEEHLEGLGSLEGVLCEEASLYDGAAVAVAPSAYPELVREATLRARSVVTAGLDSGALRASAWGLEADGLGWMRVDGLTVRPALRGAHNLANSMLALAAARAAGVPLEDAVRGLAAATVPSMRTAWTALGRATLINDAYNANPPSMRAALRLLSETPGERQRVAVLGTMRELGAHAQRLHAEIAHAALGAGLNIVAGVGEMADALEATGDARVLAAHDVDELWPLLSPRLRPDALILLKASRGVRLERLVPYLTTWAATP